MKYNKKPPINKVCLQCHKEFSSAHPFKKFCCSKCYEKSLGHKKPSNKECAHCGVTFLQTLPHQKYCSDKCSSKQRNQPTTTKECLFCGVMFETSRDRQKFCSIEHKYFYYRPHLANEPREKSCAFCGKLFTAYKLRQKFCSRECGSSHRDKPKKVRLFGKGNHLYISFPTPPRECVQCGNSFTPLNKRGCFCSPQCGYLFELKKGRDERRRIKGYQPPEDLPGEEWRPVVGLDGLYSVSSLGRVKGHFDERILKQSPRQRHVGGTTRHYVGLRVSSLGLKNANGKKRIPVYRLVAQAFIPNPENKPEVNHIDGNPSNNVSTNLEWVTGVENRAHALAMGLVDFAPGLAIIKMILENLPPSATEEVRERIRSYLPSPIGSRFMVKS